MKETKPKTFHLNVVLTEALYNRFRDRYPKRGLRSSIVRGLIKSFLDGRERTEKNEKS